ncbi:oligosaccharide repeat unit polymerase Wzy [Lactobacillus ultunensis DSM 16047]|uniref:O-antigen polymerase n=2 Tax=Lactobacillus ultunensis TaxID=227945 RepID=C2EPL4_9LACO|nr:hypothetical protein HMPREF0548_1610 [Lactobacillus ultunensis DSM 16047]KRL82360.1 oligosaccharide repeat unit polymerase Wzy [Lactobacillus ultunensis DSM 16047]
MKISCLKVYKLIVLLVVILNLGILNINYNKSITWLYLSSIISIATFFVFLLNKHHIKMNSEYVLYLTLIIVLFFIQLFRCIQQFMPELSVKEAVQRYNGVFLLLLTYPILEVLKKDKRDFLKQVVIIGYIYLFFRIVVWFMFNFKGINIAPGYFSGQSGTAWTRQLGNLNLSRLSGTFLDNLLIVYSTVKVLNSDLKKDKILYGLFLVLWFMYTTIVYQSRMQAVIGIFTVLFLIYVKNKFSKNKVLNYLLLLLLLFAIIMSYYDNIVGLLQSFSTTDSMYGGSTAARLNGIEYFYGLWRNSNVLLGTGFLPDQIKLTYYTFYVVDYGFFMNLVEFGIIGSFIYLFPFIKGLIVGVKVIRNKLITDNMIFCQIGLTFYMTLGMVLYNYYWMDYITIMPFFISLVLYSANTLRG